MRRSVDAERKPRDDHDARPGKVVRDLARDREAVAGCPPRAHDGDGALVEDGWLPDDIQDGRSWVERAQGGRVGIVERGDHDALMALGGEYAALVRGSL